MNIFPNKLCVVALFVLILGFHILSVWHVNVTNDEYEHWQYGRNILRFCPCRSEAFYNSKMPFSALNAVPEVIGDFLQGLTHSESSPSIFFRSIYSARFVTVLFSLLLAFYVYRWSKELYGPEAGFFSLFLYTFSPNIIAHSQLITTDLYVTCMITIATYYFWKFINDPKWDNAFWSATTLGLAQLAKYTAIYIYPIFILTFFLHNRFYENKAKKTQINVMRHYYGSFLYIIFFMLISLIIINSGFFFHRSFTPLKDYSFRSQLFQNIQSMDFMDWRVPVPYPYLQGLDMVKDDDNTGATFGNIYLLGKLHTRNNNKIEGFNGYFFYAMLFKEPIANLLFILFAIFFYIYKRKTFAFLKNEIFLVMPILFFFIYFNFFFNTQIGIRYILVILPFIYIFIGCPLARWKQLGSKVKWGYVSLCFYLVVSVSSYFPHYLSYFNEFVLNKTQSYKILVDSNLDWGQSEQYLEQYKKNYPNVIINPESMVSGQIVVSVNHLVGILDPECSGSKESGQMRD